MRPAVQLGARDLELADERRAECVRVEHAYAEHRARELGRADVARGVEQPRVPRRLGAPRPVRRRALRLPEPVHLHVRFGRAGRVARREACAADYVDLEAPVARLRRPRRRHAAARGRRRLQCFALRAQLAVAQLDRHRSRDAQRGDASRQLLERQRVRALQQIEHCLALSPISFWALRFFRGSERCNCDRCNAMRSPCFSARTASIGHTHTVVF